MTTQQQQQELQAISDALLKHYGKNSLQEVMTLPEAQALMEEHRNPGVVLKMLCEQRKEGVTVDAFFLGMSDILDWNEKDEVMTKVGEGAKLWLPDGKTRVFKGVSIKGAPIQTRVKVGPATVLTNIVKGSSEVIVSGDAKVEVADHDSDYPTEPTIAQTVERIEKRKDKKRGVLRGDSGDTPTIIVGTIGEGEDDVSYFPPQDNPRFGDGSEKLSLVVYDKEGNYTKVSKADAEQARQAYGISPTAGSQEYRHALGGEPIVLIGKMGLFIPFEGRNLDNENPENGNAVLASYAEQLRKQGLLTTIKKKGAPGGKAEALNLSKVENADHVVIEGHKVYDFVQDVAHNGELVWKGSIKATESGGQPWMWCQEKTIYAKDENGIPTDEVSRIMNPGAGIHYLNRLGGKVRLSENDPFAMLGNQLGLGDFDAPEATSNGVEATASVEVTATQE